MIWATPSETVTPVLTGAPVGLVGTLTVQIERTDGTTALAPSSAGITEVEPGIYSASIVAPDVQGTYIVVWNDGAGSTSAEELEVTATGAPIVDPGMVARVRDKIGDTNPAAELLTDPQIQRHIDDWPTNVDLAAANAAEAIAAKFARDYSFQTAEGQRFDRRERVLAYMELAKELRARGGALIWPTPTPSA